jgi:SAM-dependent methyltransferase
VVPPDDIRLSFNEAAEIYDRVRPSYPIELFDDLFGLLPDAPVVIEVGPGTGQATRDLLERGASVHAIEIGPAMAARLAANLESDRLRISVGDFEVVSFAPVSADAVFSATAYHWISPAGQSDRPAAVLRRGGVLAVVDLIQVRSDADRGFFAAADPIYRRFGQGHAGPPAPTRSEVDPPIRRALDADDRFGSVTVRTYDWDQTYSAARYRDLMLSYSGTQMMEPSDRLGLLDAIESLVNDEFDGVVTRSLVATLTTANLL